MLVSIGLMSGTSMDGIDAALLETDGRSHIRSLGNVSLAYDPAFKILLKAAEYAVRHCDGSMSQAASFYLQAIHDYCEKILQLSQDEMAETLITLKQYLYNNSTQQITLHDVIAHSTLLHGRVVLDLLEKTKRSASDIHVVGYHGQTLFHQPTRDISVIVGDGQALAEQLQIMVVNDFRRQDIEAGGQGAPFAPIYHHALAVRDHKIPCVIINCGGIANVTLMTSEDENALIGFDTGPGNVLVDRLIKQRTQGREHMDECGHYGQQGAVNEVVLKALFATAVQKNGQNYFALPVPKSLDTHDCIDIAELDTLSLEDACATLETFTAQSIVQSVVACAQTIPDSWIVSGGGAYNPAIMAALKTSVQLLNPDAQVLTAEEAGWSIQAMEAELFAYLAVRSLQQLPLSFPGTTGVSKPMVGGWVYSHPHRK